MKIAIVSMVKNECDIIELFIKHNSKFADKIFLMDHQSTDGTDVIVRRMADKGYNVVLNTISELSYNQAKHITAGTNEAARSGEFDFVIPLDADEFLTGPGGNEFKDFLSASLSPEQSAHINWLTFCPVHGEYFDYANPLATCFRARSHELGNFRKIIVGGRFAENCKVHMGNHSVFNPEFHYDPVQLDYELQHVPIRSSDQIVRKILLGNYAYSLTAGRKKKQAFHWRNMLSDIRNNNYSLSNQALLDLSLVYGGNVSDDQIPTIIPDRLMDICDGCTIEYTNLAHINLIKSIDDFTVSLINSCAPPAFEDTRKSFLKSAARRLKRILFR